MPIFEFACINCGLIHEGFFHSRNNKPEYIDCQVCVGRCEPIVSTFSTGGGIGQKLSGIDDTDDLTLGKLVAEGKLPAEFKRQQREERKRISELGKINKGYEQRQKERSFTSDATED